jgi:hypothetical protein
MFYNSSFLENKKVEIKCYKSDKTFVLKLEVFPEGGVTLFLDEIQLKQLTNKLNQACSDHEVIIEALSKN